MFAGQLASRSCEHELAGVRGRMRNMLNYAWEKVLYIPYPYKLDIMFEIILK